MKRILSLVLVALVLMVFAAQLVAHAAGEKVVSIGKDLNQQQRQEMLNIFDVNIEDVTVIEVTNAEERKYLAGIAPENMIGTRAISSAYVERLSQGEGIMVSTHNITWVTKEMYANALVTAGIEDARVIAAAPFGVSGTAALTGIIKGFEEMSGERISEEAKEIANEELIQTGELGEIIGKENAGELIRQIKEEVVRRKLKDRNQIRQVVIDISIGLDINLTEKQIDDITDLMFRISGLNLNINKITKQIKDIRDRIDIDDEDIEKARGIFARLFIILKDIFRWIVSLFN